MTKHDFFLGDWKIKRLIYDNIKKNISTFDGEVKLFLKKEKNLYDKRYISKEEGTLHFNNLKYISRNNYIWEKEKKNWKVSFFRDKKTFYEFDPNKANQSFIHKCKNDIYEGKLIIGKKRYILEWKISGPKKNMIINSVFFR